jgi:hypothetical protein
MVAEGDDTIVDMQGLKSVTFGVVGRFDERARKLDRGLQL